MDLAFIGRCFDIGMNDGLGECPGPRRWRSTIKGDIVSFVTDLKQENGGSILRYGNGALTQTLMEHGFIDEFHFLLTPVAVGKGKHLPVRRCVHDDHR